MLFQIAGPQTVNQFMMDKELELNSKSVQSPFIKNILLWINKLAELSIILSDVDNVLDY